MQVEIDTVKKHNIKALYYFCDETQKEKTTLAQSLMGAIFAKSKTVHRLHSEFLDIRRNVTRILLTLSRNSENKGIVNHQLVDMIDSGSVYIKNLIMRHLHEVRGLSDETKDYIISKCKHDTNYVVSYK